MGIFYNPPGPYKGPQPYAQLLPPQPAYASGNIAINPAVVALTITGYAPAISQTGVQYINPSVAALTITGYAPTIIRTGAGTIITPQIKNNTGTILGSETSVIINVYDATTGVLVARQTGLTTDVNGYAAITDGALVVGVTYAYEVVLQANGRRLPLAAAA